MRWFGRILVQGGTFNIKYQSIMLVADNLEKSKSRIVLDKC